MVYQRESLINCIFLTCFALKKCSTDVSPNALTWEFAKKMYQIGKVCRSDWNIESINYCCRISAANCEAFQSLRSSHQLSKLGLHLDAKEGVALGGERIRSNTPWLLPEDSLNFSLRWLWALFLMLQFHPEVAICLWEDVLQIEIRFQGWWGKFSFGFCFLSADGL